MDAYNISLNIKVVLLGHGKFRWRKEKMLYIVGNKGLGSLVDEKLAATPPHKTRFAWAPKKNEFSREIIHLSHKMFRRESGAELRPTLPEEVILYEESSEFPCEIVWPSHFERDKHNGQKLNIHQLIRTQLGIYLTSHTKWPPAYSGLEGYCFFNQVCSIDVPSPGVALTDALGYTLREARRDRTVGAEDTPPPIGIIPLDHKLIAGLESSLSELGFIEAELRSFG